MKKVCDSYNRGRSSLYAETQLPTVYIENQAKKTASFYEKIEHIFDSLRKKMGLIISVKAYYKTHSVKVNYVLNFVVKDLYFRFYFGAICFCFVAFFLLNGI